MSRVVTDGYQSNSYIHTAKEKTWLLYRVSGNTTPGVYSLELSDPDAKPKQIKDFTGGAYISSKDALYCLSQGSIYKVDPAAGTAAKTEVKKDVEVVLGNEFSQMFYEVWATLEQNYYDVNFHGADWAAVRDRYAALLPYVRTRANLRTLIADLLGELNSSHLGFTSSKYA